MEGGMEGRRVVNEMLLGKASSSDIYPTQLEDYFSDSPWRLLL